MTEVAIVATSEELVESRSAREQYAGRVEVLDKVKALRLLPDGVHVTTEMVANYYEVDVEAVKKLTQRNQAELAANGLRVLSRAEFGRDIQSLPSGRGGAQSFAVFTRRTVLNVGMLLRDSPVAKEVRSYLLDAERALPHDYLSALKALVAKEELTQRQQHEIAAAKAQVAELESPAHSWERLASADGDYSLRESAQILDRDPAIQTGQNTLMAQLRELEWVDRTGQPYQRYVDQKLICRRPISYIHPHKGTEQLTYQIRLTAKGIHKLHGLLGGERPLMFGLPT